MSKEKLLLHVCCATCSPHVLKILQRDYIPTVYFYNPNIHPYEEYLKRRLEVEGYVRSLGLDFIEADYDLDKWHDLAGGLSKEPEGGVRCDICFRMRLNKAALYAATHGFEWFGTTMTVSPHKNSRLINRIGRHFAADYGISYYDADFKKHDGFKISVQMAKELDFYRQNYCGCQPSLRDRNDRQRMHNQLAHEAEQITSPENA